MLDALGRVRAFDDDAGDQLGQLIAAEGFGQETGDPGGYRVGDGLRRLFKNSPPGLRSLRNLGMSTTNQLSFIKNSLVRYALGAL